MVCVFCNNGYYLDSSGNCVKYLEYLEIKDNCNSHQYQFDKLRIDILNILIMILNNFMLLQMIFM